MRRGLALNLVRISFAVLTIVAMTYQYGASNDRAGFGSGNFFSFFTIQSNILAAVMLVLVALVRPAERTVLFDSVRGAVTLYIAITGVVFALLLDGHQESLNTTLTWVDIVVHRVIPIVLVVDWFVEPAQHRLGLWSGPAWLAYPAAWFAYTLIRGASEDWYPYPFVDVSAHRYGYVFGIAAILLVGFAAAALGFVVVGNRRLRRGVDAPAVAEAV
jgi:hypothetical protein